MPGMPETILLIFKSLAAGGELEVCAVVQPAAERPPKKKKDQKRVASRVGGEARVSRAAPEHLCR